MKLGRSITLLLTIILLVPAAQGQQKDRYIYNLVYVFENRGTEPIKVSEGDIMVPLFINASWQTVWISDSSSPYTRVKADTDGNIGVLLDVELFLQPDAKSEFTVTYSIESIDRQRPEINFQDAKGYEAIPHELVEKYVVNTETFMMDDPCIRVAADEIAGGEETVLGALTKLIEYIVTSTTYNNFELPQYPNVTLVEKQGDCDDQSILLISMARSLGIPAYLQVGIVVNPSIKDSDTSWDGHLSNSQEGVGWHGWAMIYVPPWGWIPVDLTLTSAETGIELMQKAPEYYSNIITCLEVNLHDYIGDAVATKSRLVEGSIYVSVTDKAERVYSGRNSFEMYIVAGLGLAVTGAIVFMFLSGRHVDNL